MISRNNNLSIEQIKQEIEKLKGQRINMSVNQGRKKYVNFEGVIQDTYTSIFVVKLIGTKKTINGNDSDKNEVLNKFKEVLKHKTNKKNEINLSEIDEEMTRNEFQKIDIDYDYPPIIENPQNRSLDLRTYSYIDILCGNVDIDGFMSK